MGRPWRVMDHLGSHFPADTIRQQILMPGGAFIIKSHQFESEPEKPRRCFILNRDPARDDALIIVFATTNIVGRKACRPPAVLVEFGPSQYSGLPKPSIVDCESYKVWHRPRIEKQIADGKIEALPRLPQGVLDQLRTAISNSKTLAPIDKRLVVGEEEV